MIKESRYRKRESYDKRRIYYVKQGHILYPDGATGSNPLVKAGMPSGVCPEQWILEHQESCCSTEDYVQWEPISCMPLPLPPIASNWRYHLEKYDFHDS